MGNGCCARISCRSGNNKWFPFEEDNEGRLCQIPLGMWFCKVGDGVQASIHIEKILTSCRAQWRSFWESLTLAMVKVVHPSMVGENTERTILCHISVVRVRGRLSQFVDCLTWHSSYSLDFSTFLWSTGGILHDLSLEHTCTFYISHDNSLSIIVVICPSNSDPSLVPKPFSSFRLILCLSLTTRCLSVQAPSSTHSRGLSPPWWSSVSLPLFHFFSAMKGRFSAINKALPGKGYAKKKLLHEVVLFG